MNPNTSKLDVLENVIKTKTSLRVKTNRRYIKIDAQAAGTILEWWGAVSAQSPKPRDFPAMGWNDLITASQTWAETFRKK